MNNKLVKSSILSTSLLTVMASAAISPALAKISQAYPAADKTLIKLVLTLPSLLMIPFSLLSGWLVKRVRKKHLLLFGLFIYLLGGVGGGVARTIRQLLVIRGIFGIGVGLIIPLSTSLIADFFEGEERTKMMGLSGSVSHFGGVIFLLISGWLACLSWRYAFGVYSLSIIIILMIIFWLPEPVHKRPAGLTKSRLPAGVYVCALFGVFMMIAFYAAPTNLAMFIESERQMYTSSTPLFKDRQELLLHLQRGTISDVTRDSFRSNGIMLSDRASLAVQEPGLSWRITDRDKKYIVKKEVDKLVIYSERLGRPGIAGYFLSAMTLTGVVSGIILTLLIRILGPYSSTVGIGLMGLGYLLLGRAGSLPTVLIAMLCIGFSSGILMPILLLRVARITPHVSRALAMAVVSVGIYLGQFLSPVVLRGASVILGEDPFRSQFNTLALGLALATLVAVVIAIKNMKGQNSKTESGSLHH
ncbi:MAG: MFS transporter [Deltaproteobacteria bacterium]|nr:MFS transporter [Deltaproteobacteria bacterium]